jgi:REP element-mobilizing transposase RayT
MSYVSAYYHCVFSTKERRPLIPPTLQDRLWPYLGGIARENDMKASEIGGMPDHIHMLISLPSTLTIAKGMQLIKGGSSKWIHDTFPEHRLFGWQVKYGGPRPNRAPPKDDVPGGVPGLTQEAWDCL